MAVICIDSDSESMERGSKRVDCRDVIVHYVPSSSEGPFHGKICIGMITVDFEEVSGPNGSDFKRCSVDTFDCSNYVSFDSNYSTIYKIARVHDEVNGSPIFDALPHKSDGGKLLAARLGMKGSYEIATQRVPEGTWARYTFSFYLSLRDLQISSDSRWKAKTGLINPMHYILGKRPTTRVTKGASKRFEKILDEADASLRDTDATGLYEKVNAIMASPPTPLQVLIIASMRQAEVGFSGTRAFAETMAKEVGWKIHNTPIKYVGESLPPEPPALVLMVLLFFIVLYCFLLFLLSSHARHGLFETRCFAVGKLARHGVFETQSLLRGPMPDMVCTKHRVCCGDPCQTWSVRNTEFAAGN